MVEFWTEARKKQVFRLLKRIKHFEKHGVGQAAMDAKKRLQTLQKTITDSKL